MLIVITGNGKGPDVVCAMRSYDIEDPRFCNFGSAEDKIGTKQ